VRIFDKEVLRRILIDRKREDMTLHSEELHNEILLR
jgi:hypothetical protein